MNEFKIFIYLKKNISKIVTLFIILIINDLYMLHFYKLNIYFTFLKNH